MICKLDFEKADDSFNTSCREYVSIANGGVGFKSAFHQPVFSSSRTVPPKASSWFKDSPGKPIPLPPFLLLIVNEILSRMVTMEVKDDLI